VTARRTTKVATAPPLTRGDLSATVSTHYCRAFPGAWPNLSEYIEASVECHPDGRWWARCHLSLPNEAREQWNSVRPWPSLEEAAAYAAAFVLEAERIVAALQAGEDIALPHRLMAAECAAELGADPELTAIRATRGPSEHRNAWLEREFTWYRARDFRDYLGRAS